MAAVGQGQTLLRYEAFFATFSLKFCSLAFTCHSFANALFTSNDRRRRVHFVRVFNTRFRFLRIPRFLVLPMFPNHLLTATGRCLLPCSVTRQCPLEEEHTMSAVGMTCVNLGLALIHERIPHNLPLTAYRGRATVPVLLCRLSTPWTYFQSSTK